MPSRFRFRLVALAILALAAAGLAPLHADDDHERAREAVRSGRALPLSAVLAAVERDFAGQVLDVELDDEDGVLIYEIELLGPGGRKLELEYDASTGRLLSAEGPGLDAARRSGARQ